MATRVDTSQAADLYPVGSGKHADRQRRPDRPSDTSIRKETRLRTGIALGPAHSSCNPNLSQAQFGGC